MFAKISAFLKSLLPFVQKVETTLPSELGAIFAKVHADVEALRSSALVTSVNAQLAADVRAVRAAAEQHIQVLTQKAAAVVLAARAPVSDAVPVPNAPTAPVV